MAIAEAGSLHKGMNVLFRYRQYKSLFTN